MPTSKETFNTKMNALADAINAKAGTTGAKDLDGMKSAVEAIPTGGSMKRVTIKITTLDDSGDDVYSWFTFTTTANVTTQTNWKDILPLLAHNDNKAVFPAVFHAYDSSHYYFRNAYSILFEEDGPNDEFIFNIYTFGTGNGAFLESWFKIIFNGNGGIYYSDFDFASAVVESVAEM